MAVKRISAEALLALAVTTLREEIAPHLPAEQRYAAAMVGKALEIASREIVTDAEAPLWRILDQVYDDGDGSAEQLARDIRLATVSERTRSGLGHELLALLEAELAIVNPRFLAARKPSTDKAATA